MQKSLSGTEIVSVYPYYENILVSDGKESFFITPKDLAVILSEFDFKVQKKKTRKWLSVDIDDWTVEKSNEPRS